MKQEVGKEVGLGVEKTICTEAESILMPVPCLDDLRGLRKDQGAWSRLKEAKRGREGPESTVFGSIYMGGVDLIPREIKKRRKKTKGL